MADLKVRHLVVGAVATNCYIAENKKKICKYRV